MSRVSYSWKSSPPPGSDVYVTRRNESKYQTLRYWDGATWWEIAWSRSRGGKPFTWPKKSRTRFPTGLSRYRATMGLRKISAYLGEIQWGEPFKVFDEKEVLAHLVKTGVLPADWRTAYQAGMRGEVAPVGDQKEFHVVIAQCGEGVVFSYEKDARWTLKGKGPTSCIGYPSLGEAFRDMYGDTELKLFKVQLAGGAA